MILRGENTGLEFGFGVFLLSPSCLSLFPPPPVSVFLEWGHVLTKIQWDVWRVASGTCLKKTQELCPEAIKGLRSRPHAYHGQIKSQYHSIREMLVGGDPWRPSSTTSHVEQGKWQQ